MIDLEKLIKLAQVKNRYQKRISQLQDDGIITKSIEESVEKSIENLKENISSFVIYGEPQSGKTELMIALTAKLLDEGHKIIVLLVNDNVQLLSQNLQRFKESGLDPAPYRFSEILDKGFKVSIERELIVFCTKNSSNLQKLIQKIGDIENKVIIDDEADYATPNSKINKGEMNKINELVGKLLGKNGYFIGVTATPARLDLNNTFDNQNSNWVNFKPHPYYTGQETFFPDILDDLKYELHKMPEFGDDPKHIQNALFHFMINVAYLNTLDDGKEKNYSMLVHTSGVKAGHWKDYDDIMKIFNNLSDISNPKSIKLFTQIFEIAKNKFPGKEDDILEYIFKNKDRKTIVMINSDGDKENVDGATNPQTLFTIAIGGNIVSRGVTFNNLLCMFFTRDVKHKIQQDTYIQRARMFGARGKYLKYFMLFIPEKLFLDWHRAFVYHRLALESIRKGNGLVWLEDKRISAASNSSVDKTNISLIKGEMYFSIFEFDNYLDEIIIDNSLNSLEKLKGIRNRYGSNVIPEFLIDFIEYSCKGDDLEITIFESLDIKNRNQPYIDKEEITTEKESFITDLKKRTNAMHWIRPVYYSGNNKTRIYYRYNNEKIKFLRNKKYDS